MDQVRIFNRDINETEALALYNQDSYKYKLDLSSLSLSGIPTIAIRDIPTLSQSLVASGGADSFVESTKSSSVTTSNYVYRNDFSALNKHDIFEDGSAVVTYDFDENFKDLGGNYHITSTNTPFASGIYGSCIACGAGVHASIPTGAINFGDNAFSVSFWANAVSYTTYNLMFATSSSNDTGFFTINVNSGVPKLGFFNGSTRPELAHQHNMDEGTDTWYHIVATRGTDKVYRLYLNGVVSSSTLTDTMTVNNNSPRIGNNPAVPTSEYFNGFIDQFRIFNRELTQAEVNVLFYEQNKYPIIQTTYDADLRSGRDYKAKLDLPYNGDEVTNLTVSMSKGE